MPINRQIVLRILDEIQAVITDSHVVYTSGRHGTAYVNKDAVYPHTKKTSFLCTMLASEFVDDEVDVVIAPAVGGVILSQWTAHHLSCFVGREVLGVYADKTDDGNFVIKRGYDKLIAGKRVLVVEDVLTTGGSAKKTVEAVRACRGNVVGVGVLCNRGGITTQDLADVPRIAALMEVTLETWDEADCPLCKRKVPINKDVGKGREFVIAHEIL